jgi:hypothetical protein
MRVFEGRDSTNDAVGAEPHSKRWRMVQGLVASLVLLGLGCSQALRHPVTNSATLGPKDGGTVWIAVTDSASSTPIPFPTAFVLGSTTGPATLRDATARAVGNDAGWVRIEQSGGIARVRVAFLGYYPKGVWVAFESIDPETVLVKLAPVPVTGATPAGARQSVTGR